MSKELSPLNIGHSQKAVRQASSEIFTSSVDFIAKYAPVSGVLADACAAYGVGPVWIARQQQWCNGLILKSVVEKSYTFGKRRRTKLPVLYDNFASVDTAPTNNESGSRVTTGITQFPVNADFPSMYSTNAIRLQKGATGNSFVQLTYTTPANHVLEASTLLFDIYKAPGTPDALMKIVMFDSAVAQSCTAMVRVKGIGRQMLAVGYDQFNSSLTVFPPRYEIVSPYPDANSFNDVPVLVKENPITSLVGNGTTATVQTKKPHGLQTGAVLNIIETYPNTLTESNKSITVTGANTFTYSSTVNATDSSTGGVSKLRFSEVSQVPFATGDEIYIGGVYLAPALKAVAMIHFDDANTEIATHAKPILDYFGFKGVFNLHTGLVNSAGYVSFEQLDDLYAGGWDLCVHSHLGITPGTHASVTYSHPNDLYWLNNAPLSNTDNIITSLVGNGTTATVTTQKPHGIPVGVSGFKVNMVNCTPSGFNVSGAGITAIDDYRFTYSNATSGTASAAQYNENGFNGQYGLIRRPIEEIRYHVSECKRLLDERGYTRSSKYMAFPQGAWDNRVIQVLDEVGITIARDTYPAPMPFYGQVAHTDYPASALTYPIDTNQFIPRGPVISLSTYGAEGVSVATNNANVKKVAENGGVGTFLLHGGFTFTECLTSGTPGNLLYELCKTLKAYSDAGLLDVMTISEFDASLQD